MLIELKTHGFYLQRIFADDLPFCAEWEVAPLTAQEKQGVERALEQPYTFLGAGSECFAFLSADGKTVIKFFKLDPLRPVYFRRGLFAEDHSASVHTLIPSYPFLERLPYFVQHAARRVLGMREFRIQRTFSSLKTSYENLKEETGLLYLHLNPTQGLRKTITLYDPIGIAHQIALDGVRFYLQEKAIPLTTHFLSLKEKNDHYRTQQSLDSLFSLIIKRCSKGFADRDPYNKNFGFIGNRAIEIDTGSFIPSSLMQQPRYYKQELFYITLELKEWAMRNYLQMLPFLDARIAEEIVTN
jgi:hypothetical protein